MFLMFISMFYISVLGINIGSMEQHTYLPLMLNIFSPFNLLLNNILYVLYVMLHCLDVAIAIYSRRRWLYILYEILETF